MLRRPRIRMHRRHTIATAIETVTRTVRRFAPERSIRRRLLRAVNRRLPRRPVPHAVARVVFAYAASRPDARFVQVGSNDGIQLDPLRAEILHRRWRGIMVEPVPYVFERLVANYGHLDHLAFENVAIADADGTAEFHYLPQAESGADIPEWYDALGSFRREVVLSHRRFIPDIDERIASMTVPTVTFDTLCARHGLETVDVVQIDTEGYDYEVIRRIDFERYRPEIVLYEHLHLDASDRGACERLLADAGFELLSNGMDTLAIHRRVLADERRVRRVWQAVRDDDLGRAGTLS